MPGTACPAESAGTHHKMRRHSGENPSKTRTLVAHSLFSGVPGCLTLPEKDAKSRPARYVFPFLSFPKEGGRPICRKIPVHGTGSRPLIWPHPWPPCSTGGAARVGNFRNSPHRFRHGHFLHLHAALQAGMGGQMIFCAVFPRIHRTDRSLGLACLHACRLPA